MSQWPVLWHTATFTRFKVSGLVVGLFQLLPQKGKRGCEWNWGHQNKVSAIYNNSVYILYK